jgi:hypothetical protein
MVEDLQAGRLVRVLPEWQLDVAAGSTWCGLRRG